jgi:plasmid stabilization system protein ParE
VTRAAVNFTTTARRDLASIVATIAENSGRRTAARWRGMLESRARSLANHPFLGTVDDTLGPGRRRLVISPYLIVYRVRDDREVTVLRILHGARDLPSLFEGQSSD